MGTNIRHLLKMENKIFKTIFNDFAKKHNFLYEFGGWFILNKETILVLDLQKSNYSNLFYLNIKIYIQALFGNTYIKSKNLVKIDIGDIFNREPSVFNIFFDLENSLTEEERCLGIDRLFTEFLNPFSINVTTVKGIVKLAKENQIHLLPAVKQAIDEL